LASPSDQSAAESGESDACSPDSRKECSPPPPAATTSPEASETQKKLLAASSLFSSLFSSKPKRDALLPIAPQPDPRQLAEERTRKYLINTLIELSYLRDHDRISRHLVELSNLLQLAHGSPTRKQLRTGSLVLVKLTHEVCEQHAEVLMLCLDSILQRTDWERTDWCCCLCVCVCVCVCVCLRASPSCSYSQQQRRVQPVMSKKTTASFTSPEHGPPTWQRQAGGLYFARVITPPQTSPDLFLRYA
jgi:hypothetical protein